MKRILMLALMVLSVLSAWAYDFSAKNEDGVEIWYNVLSGSECEVAQNPSNNYKDAVCIPGNGDAKDSDALAALQISVYASVEGYADSETVTYNLLDLIKAPADLNGDGRLSAADVTTLVQMVLATDE